MRLRPVTVLVALAAVWVLWYIGWELTAGRKPLGSGAPPLGPAVTTPSGLQYEELKIGSGPSPKEHDGVMVLYTGWLTNGKVFDRRLDPKKPFGFVPGSHTVIEGWEEGVRTMKVGGKRRLIVPPELGYGEKGSGPIPPNATLVFEIELLRIERDEDKPEQKTPARKTSR